MSLQITVKLPVTFELTKLVVNGHDCPRIEVDLDTGAVTGVDNTICEKVVDRCSCELWAGENLVAYREADYVPYGFGIGGGDYLEFDVEGGFIEDWTQPSPDVDDLADDWTWNQK